MTVRMPEKKPLQTKKSQASRLFNVANDNHPPKARFPKWAVFLIGCLICLAVVYIVSSL